MIFAIMTLTIEAASLMRYPPDRELGVPNNVGHKTSIVVWGTNWHNWTGPIGAIGSVLLARNFGFDDNYGAPIVCRTRPRGPVPGFRTWL